MSTRIHMPTRFFVGSSLAHQQVAPSDGFTPPGSPILWLDATQIEGLSDTDPVALWEDQSGQGNDAVQTTEGNKPAYVAANADLNNLPSIRFTRSTLDNLDLTGMTDGASDYTFTFVLSPGTIISNQVEAILDIQTGRLALEIGTGSTGIRYFDTSYRGTTNIVTGAQIITYSLEATASGTTYKNENVLESSLSYATQRSLGGTILLGGHYTNQSNYDGDIAEVIVYNSILSGGDFTTLIAGLKTKWGIV